ncbi:Calcium-transporting ATPase sarcoplasmic/endoplasmic reticulum type [Diplonema papillatum]|nr:Calcium-transporting ATPase sarcoplasmic/endoplasmic reticulum type [Diplonema papillatum]|eukprot:gene4293-6633_t
MPQYMTTADKVSVDEVVRELKSSLSEGLTEKEAEARLEEYGKNGLPEEPPKPLIALILEQFEDLLVRILLGAAVVSFGLAFLEEDEDEKLTAYIEPCVILVILILNAGVGVWQERSADDAIKALMKLTASKAVVLREGKERPIPSEELVPGDVILCNNGDQVPADARVCELRSTTIRIDQSTLTGESYSIIKHEDALPSNESPFSENILYSSTSVIYGKAKCIVVKTGLATEFGKIYKSTTETQTERTPLQRKLDDFGDKLTRVIGVVCLLVWVVNLPHFTSKGGWLKGCVFYLKQAVALAVAAIPEGLPAVVTTCLALGTRRMAKKKALVRKLPSVETLGCCTVVCSDKTGTLTTNKMVVRKIRTINPSKKMVRYTVKGTNFNPVDREKWVPGADCCVDPQLLVEKEGKPMPHPLAGDVSLADMAAVMALCNEAALSYNSEQQMVEKVSDAMEAALLVAVEKLGATERGKNTELQMIEEPEKRLTACKDLFSNQYKKNGTLEFTRDRKSMSVHVTSKDGDHLFAKGAPDILIERCTHLKLDNGDVVPLDEEVKQAVLDEYHTLASGAEALRCLGFATKSEKQFDMLDLRDPTKFHEIESDMIFLGFVGILDPPRKEVRGAVEECNQAHIRVIVITGDNKDTAEAICREIGVFGATESTEGKSYTGREFEAMSRDEQLDAVKKAKLFSRSVPEHKKTITDSLQACGFVCAMTGDGVNDALALKKADIGIAMGSGTEVAKKSADMILEDDNFSTIVRAVEEGRTIYNNTKQFIRYLISSNIGEVVCIFCTGILGMPEVLVPIQLLWVNLVTDGLPATALGFNQPDPDVMKKKPRSSSEPIVNDKLFFRYMVVGTYVGLATVAGFAVWVMFAPNGPQVTWNQMVTDHTWLTEPEGEWVANGGKKIPMTVALSVLVTVEMFNALNALSENQSLFTVGPMTNPYLILAICLSLTLHMIVLYVPVCCAIFGVAPLDLWAWKVILALSAPVILLDEILKLMARMEERREIQSAKKND